MYEEPQHTTVRPLCVLSCTRPRMAEKHRSSHAAQKVMGMHLHSLVGSHNRTENQLSTYLKDEILYYEHVFDDVGETKIGIVT